MSEENSKPFKYQAAFKADTIGEFQLGMHITSDKLSEILKGLDKTIVIEVKVSEYKG